MWSDEHFALLDFASEYGLSWTDVRIMKVWRDGRCGICGLRINLSLPRSAKWAVTIDHIIPESKGGEDEPANWQVAHRRCNSQKGDR
jgi:5-methylcytosine-specific restriction endonuclease McrA